MQDKVYNVKVDGVQDAQKDMSNLNKTVEKTETDFKTLSKAISDGTKQLAAMKLQGQEGTKAYDDLARSLGNMKDALGDARAAVNAYANDTKNLTDALDVFKTGTSVVGLFNSALVALGVEGGKTEEVIKKLAAAEVALNSIQKIQASLMNKSSGTYRLLHKLKVLVLGDTQKEAVANTALSRAFQVATGSVKGLTNGMKAFRTVLVTTGIGAVAVAVGLLIANFDKIWDALKKIIPGFSLLGDALKQLRGLFDSGYESTKKASESLDDYGKRFSDYSEQLQTDLKKINEERKKEIAIAKLNGASEKELFDIKTKYYNKTVDAYTKSINQLKAVEGQLISDEIGKLELWLEDIPEDTLVLFEPLFKKYTDYEGDEMYALKEVFKDNWVEILEDAEGYLEEHKDLVDSNLKDSLIEASKAFSKFSSIFGKQQQKFKEYIVQLQNYARLNKEIAEEEKDYLEIRLDMLDETGKEKKRKANEQISIEELKIYELEKLGEEEINLINKREKLLKDRLDKKLISQDVYNKEYYKLETQRLVAIKNIQKDEIKLDEAKIKRKEELGYEELAIIEERENLLKKQRSEDLINQRDYNLVSYSLETERLKTLKSITNRINELFSGIKDAEHSLSSLDYDQVISTYEDIANKTENLSKARYHYEEAAKEKILKINNDYIDSYRKLEAEYLKNINDRTKTDEERNLIKEKFVKEELLLEKNKDQAIANASKELNERLIELEEERKNHTLTITGETINTISGITESIFELIDANIQRSIDSIEKAINSIDSMLEKVDRNINRHINRLTGYYEALSDATGEEKQDLLAYIKDQEDALNHQYDLEKQLEAEKYQREKQLQKEQAIQQKKQLQNQLIQAIITGAANTLNGFNTQPFMPVGIAMGALAATLSAVQIGVIGANIGRIKYANGGLLSGPSHNDGGIPVGNTGVEVEGGEYVVNKKATAKYLPLLEQINDYGSSVRKFANGGEMNLTTGSDQTAALLSNINFNPVVAVTDINRANSRLDKVKVLSR